MTWKFKDLFHTKKQRGMIQILTPAVGYFHSAAIEDKRPSVAPYVGGYMAITTPFMIDAAHTLLKKEIMPHRFRAAVLAGVLANGALYGVGRTIGHVVNH